MVDFKKVFELIKDKPDAEAQTELQSYFSPPFERQAFIDACYVPSNANSSSTGYQSYGYGHTAVSGVKGDSLFAFAVTHKKLHCAASILKTLGVQVLQQNNEHDENGYLAVAKCDDLEFRRWFLTESPAKNISMVTDAQKEALNQVSKKNETALSVTVSSRQRAEEVPYWLGMGADPSIKDEKGLNALHHACRANSPDAVRIILQKYPTLKDSLTSDGQTPLHLAAKAKGAEAVSFLLQQRCTPAVRDKNLYRPLHIALYEGCAGAAQALLLHSPMIATDSGDLMAHANVLDGEFDFPLHIFIHANAEYTPKAFDNMLAYLFDYGADPYAKDKDGVTAVALAAKILRGDKKEIFWEAHQKRVKSPLFTLSTLIECLQDFCGPGDIQNLITHLKAKLLNVEANPIAEVQHGVLEQLKSKVREKYPHNYMLAQAICAVIDDVNQPQLAPQGPRPDMSVLRLLLDGPVSQQPDPNVNQAVVSRPGGFH